MKINFRGSIFTFSNVLLLLILATGCASTQQSSSVRVVEERNYIRLEHLQNAQQQTGTNRSDVMPMPCSKCKIVWYPVQTGWALPPSPYGFEIRTFNHSLPRWERRHYCPGCKSVITTTREGKQRSVKVEHSCANCGDTSMLCCTTTAGGAETPGMGHAGATKRTNAPVTFQ